MRALAPEFVVMLAGITAALHVGKLPPAIPVLQDALGVTLVQAGFLLSLVQLAGMLAGALIGLLADSAGLRRSVLLGLAILALTSLLGSQAQSATMLLLLRGIEGFGFLLVTLAGPGLIRHLVVPEKLSLRLGGWGCYMGLGTGTALLAGPWVMARIGWQGWWGVMALLSLLMLLWVWRVVPLDQQLHTRQEGPVGGALGRVLGRLKLTLSHPGPWFVAMIFAAYSGQWLSVIGFLPSIYSETGISAALVGPLTALAAVVNIFGNVVSGRLLHAGIGARQILYGGFAVMALTTWLAFSTLTAESPWLRYMAILTFSAIGGMVPGALFSLAVRLAPDSSVISTCVGWMLQWSAFGQFITPPAIAWLAAQAGGWHWTWAVTGMMSLIGGMLVSRVSRLQGFSGPH